MLRFLVLLAWGFFVVADFPQFSSISARSCPPQSVGSALAIQNSISFLITIVSITVLLSFIDVLGSKALWMLLLGFIFRTSGNVAPVTKSENPRHMLKIQTTRNQP